MLWCKMHSCPACRIQSSLQDLEMNENFSECEIVDMCFFPRRVEMVNQLLQKGRKKIGGPSPSGSEPLREKIVGEEGGGVRA